MGVRMGEVRVCVSFQIAINVSMVGNPQRRKL